MAKRIPPSEFHHPRAELFGVEGLLNQYEVALSSLKSIVNHHEKQVGMFQSLEGAMYTG